MVRSAGLHLAFLAFALLLAGTFASLPVYGDDVTLTLTSTNLSSTEAGSTPTLDFTWSNNSSSAIEFWPSGLNVSYTVTFLSGDSTDQVISHFGFPFNPGTCTGLIASGSTCSFSANLVYLLDPPSTTEDADFGVDLIDFVVAYVPCDPATGGCSSSPLYVDSQFDFTTFDTGANVPTPEPSTLISLGCGLVA